MSSFSTYLTCSLLQVVNLKDMVSLEEVSLRYSHELIYVNGVLPRTIKSFSLTHSPLLSFSKDFFPK